MSEGRKKSRKSKLEVRVEDVEENEKRILQKQPAVSILKKRQNTQSTNQSSSTEETTSIVNFLDHTYSLKIVSQPASPIKLSVKIEVEEFDESIMNTNTQVSNVYAIAPLSNSKRRATKVNIVHVDLDKILKVSDHITWSSTNEADKHLGMVLKNEWGKILKEPEHLDPYNNLIQDALHNWSLSNGKSIKEPPIFYQCIICNLAWWYLDPFRDHIRCHDSSTLKVYHQENAFEAFIVAAYEFSNVPKYIEIDEDCYRCGRSYRFHVKLDNVANYICRICFQFLPTCTGYNNHYQDCSGALSQDNPKSHKCPLCSSKFLWYTQDLDAHMAKAHLVRSDIPVLMQQNKCLSCRAKYLHSHVCPKTALCSECKYCYKKFKTKTLMDYHDAIHRKKVVCKICQYQLERSCMLTEHMMNHTNRYKMAFRCIVSTCSLSILFPDETSARMHTILCHIKKKYDKRRCFYEKVIVPEKCLKMDTLSDTKHAVVSECPTAKELPAEADCDIADSRTEEVAKITEDAEVHIKEEVEELEEVESVGTDGDDSQDTGISYEVMLSKMFQVANDNARPSVSGIEITQVKTETSEEQDFESLIDSQNDPIIIKEEPIETIDVEETSVTETFEIEDDRVIKVEPQEEISIVWENDLANIQPEQSESDLQEDMDLDLSEDTIPIIRQIRAAKTEDKALEILMRTLKNRQRLTGKKNFKLLNAEEVNDLINPEESIKQSSVDKNKSTEDSNTQAKKLKLQTVLKRSVVDEINSIKAKEVNDMTEESKAIENVEMIKVEVQDLIPEDSQMQLITLRLDGADPELDTQQADWGTIEETNDDNTKTNNKKVRKVRDAKGQVAKRLYTCRICGYTNRHKLFKIHKDSHCELNPDIPKDIAKKFECTKCDKAFSTLKTYIGHFSEHGFGPLHCPACNLKFESLKDLLPHFHRHMRQSFVNCWRLNRTDSVTKKQQRCQKCRQTVTPDQFFSHWENHLQLSTSPPDPGPILTTTVPLKGSNSKELKSCILRTALQQLCSMMREKQCMVCSRMFERRNDCKRHIIEHLLLDACTKKQSTIDLTLRCQICSASFQRSELYKFHMREHAALPVYRCDLCNKTFSDSSNFAKHKKIHSLKVLICDICQKKFHAKAQLEKHMIMHQVTEPLKCRLCDKVFYTQSMYRKHQHTRHGRVSKFKCILCDVWFDTLREKWDHAWTVHKERKFLADCPVCQKKFRKYADVKMHAKLVHRIDVKFFTVKSEAKRNRRCTKRTDGETLCVYTET